MESSKLNGLCTFFRVGRLLLFYSSLIKILHNFLLIKRTCYEIHPNVENLEKSGQGKEHKDDLKITALVSFSVFTLSFPKDVSVSIFPY